MASYALASKLVGPGKQEGEADGLRETDESSEERERVPEKAPPGRGGWLMPPLPFATSEFCFCNLSQCLLVGPCAGARLNRFLPPGGMEQL